MSLCRVLVAVLVLGAIGCLEAPVPEARESVVDQSTGLPPSCPAGQSTITWTGPPGACGTCRLSGTVGGIQTLYAGCSGDPEGTARAIQNSCVSSCVLN